MVSTRRSEYTVNSSKVNYCDADKGYLSLYLYLFMMPLFCIAYHLENKLFIIIMIIMIIMCTVHLVRFPFPVKITWVLLNGLTAIDRGG